MLTTVPSPCPPRAPLQALSKRIHYGMFVAEAKFRKQTAEYTQLIQRRDADAIMALLTDRAVELKVCVCVCVCVCVGGGGGGGGGGAAEGPLRMGRLAAVACL